MKRRFLRSSVFLVVFTAISMLCFLSASAAEYVTQGSLTYYIDGKEAVVTKYNGNAEKVTVPSKIKSASVVGIADQAFWSKKSMKSLTLPSTLRTIGRAAFNECTGLTKLILPSKLKTISASAFWYCSNLEAVYIPPSVTSIGSNSFRGCKKLTAYVMPDSYAEKYAKASKDVKLGYRYASSIKADKTAISVPVSSTTKIGYTIKPSVVYNKKVIFRSSNTKIATVSSTGVVKGISCGKVIITVITADGSKKSAKITVTVTPQKVTGLNQTDNSISSFTLTWKASKGAMGYGVYAYDTANKKWVLKKTTTALKYTATGLKSGYSAYYRVVAFAKAGKTVFKAPASEKTKAYVLFPGKVTGLTAESTANSVKLTWKKASNATGYLVYRYNTATKEYELIGKTPKLTATIKSLKANTKYTFAVRAFLVYQGKTVTATDYAKGYVAYTLPSKVSNFAIDHDSVSSTGARLIWNKMSGVDGYELYSCTDNAGTKRTLVAKLNNSSVTGYTVSSLKQGQSKKFIIRAYVKRNKTLYGAFSPVITVTALTLPANRNDAFNGFIKALNASKNSETNFYLIKSTEVSNLTGNHIEDCSDIINAVATPGIIKYNFIKGVDEVTSLPATHFISPFDTNSDLTLKNVKSFIFNDEKDGYSISLELNSEKETLSSPAATNFKITPGVNWSSIAPNFYLGNCLYEGTSVKAKVRNGKIDSMTITVPMQYTFRYKATEYKVSETVTHTYIFGW